MCGRYYRSSDKQRLAEAFHISRMPDNVIVPPWDYNISPTTYQPVIRSHRDTGERQLSMMRWGIVPHFAKSMTDFKAVSTANARAETLRSSAIWQMPFEGRRCLVPADGFYEWARIDSKNKQPYAFMLIDEMPLCFAGLWEEWKDPVSGKWLESFTIITTSPNELAAEVHDRMPVIVGPMDYDRWLIGLDDDGPPIDLLKPFPANAMKAYQVDKEVEDTENNYPGLLKVAEGISLYGAAMV